MEIAVTIPCYNEAMTIEKVICDFREALPDARINVFDNNSTDATVKIAAGAGARGSPAERAINSIDRHDVQKEFRAAGRYGK